MRRIIILGAIWLALFAVTVGANILSGSGRATADVVEQSNIKDVLDNLLRTIAQMELAAKPRKSAVSMPRITSGPDNLLDEKFESELRTVILDSRERFRGCASHTLASMRRPNEYFEISFFLKKAGGDEAFIMEDPILERTTAPFTSEEESCMFNVLQQLRFVADS